MKASEIVAKVSRKQPMTEAQIEVLIEAVAADLTTVIDQARVAEERLLKIEAQMRALATAVIAIADTVTAVDVAVQALKDEMAP